MGRLKKILQHVDNAVFQLESFLIVAALLGMTVLVFGDVVQRLFARDVSKTAQFLMWLFVVFAIHTRKKNTSRSFFYALALGTLMWGILGLTVRALLHVFPTGIAGAQKFALGFMMWASLLGASVATKSHRHIVLSLFKKIISSRVAPLVALISGVTTSIFCFFMTYLSLWQTMDEYSDWHSGEGVGVFEALPIPVWIVTLVLPISFFIIGTRFFCYAISNTREMDV